MHILVITSKFPYPLKDGGAIATYSLLTGLANSKNQLYLLSLNTKKHFINAIDIPESFFSKINFTLVEADTSPKVRTAAKNLLFSKLPYIAERFKIEKFALELARILQSKHFDVVQIEGLYLLQYIDIIKANSSAKIAYRPHNIEYQIWNGLSHHSSSILKKMYFKILSDRILKYEISLINKYDLLLPISDEDYNFYKSSGNNKPFLIVPTGFEIRETDIIKNELADFSIFFIGSMEWLPNQDGIIWFIHHCWKTLHSRFPGLKLYIAGRNAPEKLINLFNSEGIIWCGEIDNASEFIKDKSIMIVPLLSGSGMRIKIIEALTHRKPVVSTTLGARGTKTTNAKNILLADSSDEFVEQISRLIADFQLYKKLSDEGLELAKKYFDKEIISGSLIDFYEQNVQF